MAKRIGIVEDEGIVALDLSSIVKKLDYETAFIADSGEKTMEHLKEVIPDAILMDIELKGDMNGIQLARKIKEKYNIPIIFLTAFEDESTMSKIVDVSEYGYLVKPFEDEVLKIELEKALS
jgi:CheY-like chemotaxis protein